MSDTVPTAAVLVIGNEILSGSTQDINVAFIAKRLTQRGVRLLEVRVVPDIEAEIVDAVNALRKKFTYVFTTGGIGPTHDDITSASIAKAFSVAHVVAPEAKKRLEDYYKNSGTEINEARLRMATLPAGSVLIDNPVSAAPGFHIGNVFVMAGVPKIMQAMFNHVDTMIEGGPLLHSITVESNMKEGDIGKELGEIQKEFADIDIGSYPHMYQTPSLSIILRGTDEDHLHNAATRVKAMLRAKGEEPII
ncbi:MAG TPA: molybdopterin-binding protein [Patescibacteria group bacterium]|nr:molybdopterin-binding protein [Patescibacteria group bacterium]